MFCTLKGGKHLSINNDPKIGSYFLFRFPYHNLGFSLVGFTRSTSTISSRTRLYGTLCSLTMQIV